MENIILEKYQKSPLILGCSTLSDEFFEHKSIAILFNDIPIIIVGINNDKNSLFTANELISCKGFINLLDKHLGTDCKLTVDVVVNKVVSPKVISIKSKVDNQLKLLFTLPNDELSKIIGTLMCLDPNIVEIIKG